MGHFGVCIKLEVVKGGTKRYCIFVDGSSVVLYCSTKLNNRQKKILKDVFTDLIKPNIPWKDIVSMLIALGAEVNEGSGSRVRFFLNNRIAVFHRPHPERVTDKGAVKSVREFIVNSGIEIKDYL